MADILPPIDGNRRLLNRTGATIAILLVLILASAMGAIMRFDIPEKNHDIILILVTTVSNAVIGIVGYFFGSSVSNSRQGDIIATQASTASKVADLAAAAQGQTTSTATVSQTTTAPAPPP